MYMCRCIYQFDLNRNASSLPPYPSNHPHACSNQNANDTAHGPETIALPTKALSVIRDIGIILGGVDGSRQASAGSLNHGNNSPISAEVFYAPDNRDDDGDKGETGAVAEANEGGC